MRDPVTWEWAILVADAALRLARGVMTPLVETAILTLLAFDTYARPSDWLLARRSWLIAPVKGQRGSLAAWTITFYPATQTRTDKAGLQDDTVSIGTTNPRRAWLSDLAGLWSAHRPKSALLFTLTLRAFETNLRFLAHQAQLEEAVPQRLRHGGASADAIIGLSDLELQTRGRWSSNRSVVRYRKPGRYLRHLGLLSSGQPKASHALEPAMLRSFRQVLR